MKCESNFFGNLRKWGHIYLFYNKLVNFTFHPLALSQYFLISRIALSFENLIQDTFCFRKVPIELDLYYSSLDRSLKGFGAKIVDNWWHTFTSAHMINSISVKSLYRIKPI